jgi:CheY-like chemotaxis protein
MASILLLADLCADAVLAEVCANAAGRAVTLRSPRLESLEVLGEDAFELIIVDLARPRAAGTALLRALRADDAHADRPILGLLSPGASFDDLGAFVAAGMSAAVCRPCRFTVLYAAITEALAAQEAGNAF